MIQTKNIKIPQLNFKVNRNIQIMFWYVMCEIFNFTTKFKIHGDGQTVVITLAEWKLNKNIFIKYFILFSHQNMKIINIFAIVFKLVTTN